ncbi:hypothetical protein QNJ25_00350 [Macrococcus caseolyticus]|uniref:hypothetical protein n=1 Tax=Macrococcoides caseolyticum TaxID=69966 RepID=UPI0024BC82C2|nr:hypothetical protein [Macrococcus caseolyticus]MDJ1152392.1 hypothetical protein [Macrococcus caseolyticus]
MNLHRINFSEENYINTDDNGYAEVMDGLANDQKLAEITWFKNNSTEVEVVVILDKITYIEMNAFTLD